MMKKIYLALITLITIGCMIFGLLLHIGRLNLPVIHLGNIFGFNDQNSPKIDVNEGFDDVSSIYINCALSRVTFKSGNDSKVVVSYRGRENLKPSWELKDGSLNITQKSHNELNGNNENYLDITFPAGVSYEDIVLDLDLGNVEIADLTAEKIDISADLGNIEGRKISAKEMTVDADLGNVELYNASFTDLDVSADMGNVTVQSVNDISGYDVHAKVSLGNLNINGEKVVSDYKQEGNAGKIKVKASMGNVDLID